MAIHMTLEIDASAQTIFSAITDLESYNKWLPHSLIFNGTQVSETQIRLGTTYTEIGGGGVRRGKITEFEEPFKVAFTQPMTLNPQSLGMVVDATLQMILREEGNKTILERNVTLGYPWTLWPFKMIFDEVVRRESWRTINFLKKHVESVQ